MSATSGLTGSTPLGVEDAEGLADFTDASHPLTGDDDAVAPVADDDGDEADAGTPEYKVKLGRPRKVNRRLLAKRVFAKMANGMLSKDACKSTGVKYRTLMDWVRTDPTLMALWQTARHQQAHALAEQAVRVAKRTLLSPESTAKVQAARLHLDAIRWYVARTNPADYGVHRQLDAQMHTLRIVYENSLPSNDLRRPVNVDSHVAEAEFAVLPAPAIPLQSVPPVHQTGDTGASDGLDDDDSSDVHHQSL